MPAAVSGARTGNGMAQWLSEVSEGWLFVLLLLSLQGAAELGLWLARSGAQPAEASVEPPEQHKAEVSAIQGAVLGLLALLLGFTFAMAAQRFEDRKLLIRDEANTLGTVGLRIELLPAQQHAHVRQLLRSYADTRLTLQQTSFVPAKLAETHQRSLRLQEQLWAEAVAAARQEPGSETISLFVSSLNDLIDLHGKQLAAIRNRIPGAIFLLLFLVSVVSLGLAGYGLAPRRRLSVALTLLLSLLVGSVLLLIVDLHRPARGLVTVSLTSLEEARDGLRP